MLAAIQSTLTHVLLYGFHVCYVVFASIKAVYIGIPMLFSSLTTGPLQSAFSTDVFDSQHSEPAKGKEFESEERPLGSVTFCTFFAVDSATKS